MSKLQTHFSDGSISQREDTGRVMILMRGLPSCGKSYTSQALIEKGGVRIEFDEFFYTQVGNNPCTYNWSKQLMPRARLWNLARIKSAVDTQASPIVVDSDNNNSHYTRQYVGYAMDRGYRLEFAEPTSPWWLSIRKLLADKKTNAHALQQWACKLTAMNRGTHRVPQKDFLHRISRWEHLNVERLIKAPAMSA